MRCQEFETILTDLARDQIMDVVARERGLGIGFWRMGREDPGVWADPLIAAGTNWP